MEECVYMMNNLYKKIINIINKYNKIKKYFELNWTYFNFFMSTIRTFCSIYNFSPAFHT